MVNRYTRYARPVLVASSIAILTACGGGGGGGSSTSGTVTGLQMPNKMSVVTSEESAAKNQAARGMAGGIIADTSGFAADSDYNTAATETWIFDPSMESLSIVNEILCYIKQTGAKAMVNQGDANNAYLALINEDKCQEGSNESGAASGGAQASTSSSSGAVSFNKWTVVSTRADNSSAQIVRAWVPGEANAEHPMDGQNILVEVTVTEGVSPSKPFGEFVLNFKGVITDEALLSMMGVPAGTTELQTMAGTLKTVDNAEGKPQFSFIMQGGSAMGGAYSDMPFSMTQKSNVLNDDATGSSGQAKTFFEEAFDNNGDGDTTDEMDWQESASFDVAFDDTYFLRSKGGSDQVCTSRDNLKTQTWRYNLYDAATGALKKINSGFPFTYTDGDGEHFGHVGYWGVWTEEGLSLSDLDGQTVTKETFGSGDAAETYTVKVGNGKLWKREKQTSSYSDMVGVGFNWWGDPADPNCESGCTNQQDYRATVKDNGGGSYTLEVTHTLEYTDNGPKLTDIMDVDITPVNDWNQRWVWSENLGGSAVFMTPLADNPVVFYKESVVSPSVMSDSDSSNDVPTTLVCYEQCLKGGLTASSTISSESDLFDVTWPNGDTATAYSYTLAVVNGLFVLTNTDGEVVVPAGLDLSAAGGWYQHGVQTGQMVSGSASIANWWEVNEQDVSYRWETGGSDWNRQVVVTDGNGDVQSFDPPLQITYNYALGDDPNGDNFAAGTPFLLEYGGPGQLWGFPWEQEDENCDPSSDDCRWVSALTLKDGVRLDSGSASYVVKAIESEQTMVPYDTATNCVNAGLNTGNITLQLPSTIEGTVDFGWSDRPTVTDAPAVIEGEVQS